MRLPEDDNDRSGMTPTVLAAIIAVTAFVVVILAVVLMMNNKAGSRSKQVNVSDADKEVSSPIIINTDIDLLAGGGKLHPEDLDFWDMYPEPTGDPAPAGTPKPMNTAAPVSPVMTDTPAETASPAEAEDDPSTDGKHTLVKYADGGEEWVPINPDLAKHGYDFTGLVRQSGLMKYYKNGRKVSYAGVDISKTQGYVDFSKVKKAGIDFCMIRVGARGYGSGQLILDEYFADNIKRATDAGLKVGVYFYSQAVSEMEAIEEANMVIGQLEGRSLDYPVAFDMELIPNDTARTESLTAEQRTSIAKAFVDIIAMAGYKTAIYGNKEWLIDKIDLTRLTEYDVWLSQQEDIPDYPYRFTMWQYEFEGKVDGIAGKTGLNISFIDYSEK